MNDLDISPGREDLPDDSDGLKVSVRTRPDGGREALLVPAAVSRLLAANPSAREPLQGLQDAARAIAEERSLIDALVPLCRDAGASWDVIGWYLGVTGSAARQRWGVDRSPEEVFHADRLARGETVNEAADRLIEDLRRGR